MKIIIGVILAFVFLVLPFSPGIILIVIGFKKYKTKPDFAKNCFIAAGFYLLISGSICATILTGGKTIL